MERDQMSPVTEVALYLEKQKIRERVAARRDYAVAATTPVHAPACRIRTVPPSSYRYPSLARMDLDVAVEADEDSVIDITGDDDGCESDDSQKTMAYPEPQPVIAPCNYIPTAQPVQSARGNRYDQWQIPAFTPAPNTIASHRDIPQSLVQAYLQVKRSQTSQQVDAGMCTSDQCAYCRGGLLRQYYTLLERIVQIDRALNRIP